MLLVSPKDHAVASVRLIITELLQPNRVMMAHELVHILDEHVNGEGEPKSTSLYPSWYRRGTPGPDRPEPLCPSEHNPLQEVTRHLWNAVFSFDEAEMPRAATCCVDFGVRNDLQQSMLESRIVSGCVDGIEAAWFAWVARG